MTGKFGILILSNRRADRVKTWNLLEKRNSKLPRYVVIDDEDPTGDDYRKRFGDRVITFSKSEYMDRSDTFTPTSDRSRKIVLPARNACFDIARSLGWEFFIELDDDYLDFMKRYVDGKKLGHVDIEDIDSIFIALRDFLIKSKQDVIALAQGGDFIGGVNSTGAKSLWLRKMMNVYCFRTECDIRFYGYINEDLTASVVHGQRGDLILTFTGFAINQVQTQANAGGLTEEYLRKGTYAKSMTSVVAAPSAVTIHEMGRKNFRQHHRVQWNNAAVKVIREPKRKGV